MTMSKGMFSDLSLKEWIFFLICFFLAVYLGPILVANFVGLGAVGVLIAPSIMYVVWEKFVKKHAD
jgi:hypothetical protein